MHNVRIIKPRAGAICANQARKRSTFMSKRNKHLKTLKVFKDTLDAIELASESGGFSLTRYCGSHSDFYPVVEALREIGYQVELRNAQMIVWW